MLRELVFYTDGAYSSKSEIAGWASICLEDDMIIDEQTGYEPYSTNNRAEMLGLLNALQTINTVETSRTKVTIYMDSALLVNTLNQGWYNTWLSNGWKTSDKQDVKNQDLWLQIIPLYIKLKPRFLLDIVKVEAHKTDRWNKYVDALAVRARKQVED